MMNRRDFYRYATLALGSLIGLMVAVPGVAYLLDPLLKRSRAGAFRALVRLSELEPGSPRAVSIIEAHQDAWVSYPPEPVGSVWLIRQPAGIDPAVVAFTAECPHLGCSINLAADGQSFLCPCHMSAFDFRGQRKNATPPRGMDRLDVQLTEEADPMVLVKFERFRTMSKEKIPLG